MLLLLAWQHSALLQEFFRVLTVLIHIFQIATERIEKPQDVLKVDQVVKAKITEIDFDKKRVSLSIKALLEPVAQENNEEAEQAE